MKNLSILIVLVLSLAGAALAQDPPTSSMMLVSPDGSLRLAEMLFEHEWPLAQELKKATAQACNGGSCFKDGTTLSCPSSGGPTCKEDESCTCFCTKKTIDGTSQLVAINKCV